jgi:hypothetical protein
MTRRYAELARINAIVKWAKFWLTFSAGAVVMAALSRCAG